MTKVEAKTMTIAMHEWYQSGPQARRPPAGFHHAMAGDRGIPRPGRPVRRDAGWLALLAAACMALAMAPLAVSAQSYDASLVSSMQWRLIGPFRGGRTVGVAGVPSQPNVFYMAPNNGGIWKSENYGETWEPLFKGDENNSVGDLAVAPSDPNVIYVGSGEGLLRPDLSTGDGMYKSADAGKTWQHLGLRDGQQIASIAVDPHDAGRLFVAVLGHPYGPNSERGVFRSVDGGKTFQKVLYKGPDVGAIQVTLDPANAQTVYAVLWAGRTPPWSMKSENTSINGPGSGLFKSTDGGNTWRQIGQGLPTVAQGLGRLGIGIAPSDPKRIYAQVQASPGLDGTYRSDDAGQTFHRVNHEERIYGRGSDFAEVAVAPDNPDEIYVASTSFYRSLDAGRSFEAIKGAPGGDDYHRIWINPANPKIIALGVDQGATLTVDGGKTWSSWYNQPTASSYHIITDNQFPYRVYSSQQDSGSVGILSRSNDGQITFRDWHPVGAGEHAYIAPDPLHPNIIYGGDVIRYDWVTGQGQFVGPQLDGKYRTNRTAPLLFSPADPHVLYYGTNVLFKTTDGGQNWERISPDLSRPDPGIPSTLGVFGKRERPLDHRGVIYSIGPSFKTTDTIWAGTDDGYIWITRDGGRHWDNVTPKGMTSWSKVSMLVASHFDDQTAYAAVNRFRLDDLKPYIYRTHDGGKTWKLIVNGLPDNASANVVREDPEQKGLLIAGTERAVWYSADDGEHWQPLQLNLPQTSMRDLVIHDNDVVLGTHGRSFWILDDITPLRQLAAAAAADPAYLYKPAAAYQVLRNTYADTQMPKETPAGQNPPDGAILDYYLKAPATGPVTLEVHDATGRLAFHLSSTDRPGQIDPAKLNFPTYWLRPPQVPASSAGTHRIVWDLHYPAPKSDSRRGPISVILHDTPLGPLGPSAVPGEYTVTLTVGGQTYTQPLTLRIDPRLDTPVAGLARQFDVATQLVDDMDRTYAALQQAGSEADALRKLQARLGAVYSAIYGDQHGAVTILAAPTAMQVSAAAELHQQVAAALGPGGG
jgi:photosystem II stability/assembly factor-like uncharacterized protein